nr:hypothetical protein [Tanacetum cinerariifolium]
MESQDEHNEPLPLPSHDPLPSGEDSLKLTKLMDLYTNLSNKVLDLESKVLDIKSTYKPKIEKLESRVESMLDVNDDEPASVEEVLEVVKAAKLITKVVTTDGVDVNAASVQDTLITVAEPTKVIVPRKRRGVIIQDPKETTTVTMQPKVQAKDKGKAILIEEPKPLKRQVQINLDEEVVRQLEVELNGDINWNVVIEQVKRSERLSDAVNKEIKVPEQEVRQEKEVEVESSKREGKNLEQEISKKQKMEQETKELKKHLQIVLDDDDDMYTDATHLASKILIVDYKIHTERNRPYFKIIRADGNHRLFLSFNTMLKNFDREDLESLWKFVRERSKRRSQRTTQMTTY